MSDYDDIMELIMTGDLPGLKEVALIVDDFPHGKDDFVDRHWITNGIDSGTEEVIDWMLAEGKRSTESLWHFCHSSGISGCYAASL